MLLNGKNIWIIGDIHGDYIPIKNFYITNKDKLSDNYEDNILIVLGDFGANYFLNKRDENFKKKLSHLPFTYFVIRGNHEERPSILAHAYPTKWHQENFFNNTVLIENEYPHILYALDEGGEYEINGKKALIIPGAYSVDKWFRISHNWSWFPEEQLNKDEQEKIMEKLQKQYDYIFSHTCPLSWHLYISDLFLSSVNQSTIDNQMEKFLDNISANTSWLRWYFGHYHDNRDIDIEKGTMLFQQAIPLGMSLSEYQAYCLTF